jgi:hypothetical protein
MRLGWGLVLLDNASDPLEVQAIGPFTFPTAVASGDDYSASMQIQPVYPPQYCTVNHGSGTIKASRISDIDVACTTRFISLFAGKLGAVAGASRCVRRGGNPWSIGLHDAAQWGRLGGRYSVELAAVSAVPDNGH